MVAVVRAPAEHNNLGNVERGCESIKQNGGTQRRDFFCSPPMDGVILNRECQQGSYTKNWLAHMLVWH